MFRATLKGKELQSIIAQADAIREKTTVPILECVRLITGEAVGVMAESSCITQGVRAWVENDSVAGMTGHDIATPLPQLAPIVMSLDKDADVSLELAGSQLVVKQGRRSYKLPTLPPEDFHDPMAGIEKDALTRWKCTSDQLREAVKSVMFAVEPPGTSRYYLAGAFFDSGNHVIVATDGHKMAIEPAEWLTDGKSVIVPKDALVLFSKFTGDVDICVRETSAFFHMDRMVLRTNLIDGTFPDWQRVAPVDAKTVTRVSRDAFAEAIKACAATKSSAARFIFDSGNSTIETGRDNDDASSRIEFEADGDSWKFLANLKYMSDLIDSLPGGSDLEIRQNGEGCAVEIRAGERRRIIMPMRW